MYYTGYNIRRIFEKVINAKQAYIISPWIYEPYASILYRKQARGEAKIITSADSKNPFYNLIEKPRTRVSRLVTGIILIAFPSIIELALIPILIQQALPYIITILLMIIMIILIIIGVLLLKHSEARISLDNVRLSPSMGESGFIHIKLYIADGEAWIGSANMSNSSWRENIDVLVPISIELALSIFNYAWSRAKNTN